MGVILGVFFDKVSPFKVPLLGGFEILYPMLY